VPDPVRTESIKAFVIVKDGFPAGPQLAEDIRNFVREHLAKHEVPREIEFVEALPMTIPARFSAASCATPSAPNWPAVKRVDTRQPKRCRRSHRPPDCWGWARRGNTGCPAS
jgi:hypothetical protein